MMKKKSFVFGFSVLVFLALVVYNVLVVYDFAGKYIYPLDDAYIHLSIAKNFADYGVWGITPYEFSSTTSSPFFTLLLSVLIKVFGNWEYLPIALNVIGSFSLLFVLHNYLKKYSFLTYAIVLIGVVLNVPLHLITLVGMEHVLHALMMVLCLVYFERYITDKSSKNFFLLILFSILATGFRYESLFFIFFMCVYFFFVQKKYLHSIVLGLLAISPVIIYGLISLQQGSFFLPNSLVLKGNTNDGFFGFVMRVAGNGYRGLSVLFLVILLLVYLFKNFKNSYKSFELQKIAIPMVVFLGFGVHLLFANFGWLLRYEAYLVVIILFASIPFINSYFQEPKNRSFFKYFVLSMLLISFSMRFVPMLKYQRLASKNIFDQQIQLARFLHDYYHDGYVIANDIGAITYFNSIHLLDTYGLGSIEVAKLREKEHGNFTNNKPLQDYIQKVSANGNYNIAIVYEHWVTMPSNFVKVGMLEIKDNYMSGGSIVSFFATESKDVEKIRKQLEEFSSKAPKDVAITIVK